MKKILILFLFIISLLSIDLYSQKEETLPVELIYFESMVLSNGVLLRWGTATEINNFGFEVQRADTPYQFIGLDFVPGHGNSNSPKHYMYVDTTLPNFGVYHYRLKQIDNNGAFHFSDTLTVGYFPITVEKVKEPMVSSLVLNNYEQKEISVSLDKNKFQDNLSFSVFTVLGEKVHESIITPYSEIIKFNYSNLSSGIYLLIIHLNTNILLSQKFVVKK